MYFICCAIVLKFIAAYSITVLLLIIFFVLSIVRSLSLSLSHARILSQVFDSCPSVIFGSECIEINGPVLTARMNECCWCGFMANNRLLSVQLHISFGRSALLVHLFSAIFRKCFVYIAQYPLSRFTWAFYFVLFCFSVCNGAKEGRKRWTTSIHIASVFIFELCFFVAYSFSYCLSQFVCVKRSAEWILRN